ncbi:hypothetical protein BOW92_gp082 [Synechococcus phage S-WAM1]|jgi:hypothetical protein|uniref:Uncharacterized protein n=1 Tax=Synechococcus phage S-WAM1 TaxID=1815521 RepID=A0A1D8KSI5_9CAUD|nr:hypothetical protein BOW92_gp082 [Synechococcus phage S-WAM1]AOV61635.1 hypothetical protein P090810_162 [Synechococcus phage S-WAM1]
MITIELEPEMAVSVMQALIAEQRGYTLDETCCPLRVKKIREVILQLDDKLEEHYKDFEAD